MYITEKINADFFYIVERDMCQEKQRKTMTFLPVKKFFSARKKRVDES
jgi:hypothetical protein